MEARKSLLIRLALGGSLIATLAALSLSAVAQQGTADLPSSPGVATAHISAVSGGAQAGWELASSSAKHVQSESQQPGIQAQQPAVPHNEDQSASQKPVGTAAAESPNASGVAASQPAGVAIAPAKQRRTRTVILRVGAIIGAGVAIGTVAGLTLATSSKPPGAH